MKLHVTGCPNSCGQHWIADVGLQGVLLKSRRCRWRASISSLAEV